MPSAPRRGRPDKVCSRRDGIPSRPRHVLKTQSDEAEEDVAGGEVDMERACSTHAWKPRSRASAALFVVAAMSAFLRPTWADDPGFALGLGGRDAEARTLDAASLSPSPARLGLGLDSRTLAPASPPSDTPEVVPDDAAPPARTQTWAEPPLAAFPNRVWQDFG